MSSSYRFISLAHLFTSGRRPVAKAHLPTADVHTIQTIEPARAAVSAALASSSVQQEPGSYLHATQSSSSPGEGAWSHAEPSAQVRAISTSAAVARGQRGARPPPAAAVVRQEPRGTAVAQPSSAWTEVMHQETGQVYYWNETTNETTALGEPRPGPEGRVAQQNALPRMNQGTSLLGLVGMGAGVGLVFAILGRIF